MRQTDRQGTSRNSSSQCLRTGETGRQGTSQNSSPQCLRTGETYRQAGHHFGQPTTRAHRHSNSSLDRIMGLVQGVDPDSCLVAVVVSLVANHLVIVDVVVVAAVVSSPLVFGYAGDI